MLFAGDILYNHSGVMSHESGFIPTPLLYFGRCTRRRSGTAENQRIANVLQISASSMKCFKAILMSEPRLHDEAAHVLITVLLSSLVQAQDATQRDDRFVRDLTSLVIEFSQQRPQSEGTNAALQQNTDATVVTLMGLILPVLSRQTGSESQDLEQATLSAVLGLASTDALSFKTVLGSMEDEERYGLEQMLRSALEGQMEVSVEEKAKPSISLKLDFGLVGEE